MTTHFYLGRPDKKGLCAIYLRCREDSFVCNLNTRERVETKHWDAKRQRVKPSAPAAVHVAEYLADVERAALDGARQARKVCMGDRKNEQDVRLPELGVRVVVFVPPF